MTEQEHFLKRWSRRKLEPEEQAEPEAVPPADAATAEPASGGEAKKPAPAAPARAAAAEKPAFDISTLPSIESIGAGTDVKAFLKAGVPAELTRAALRRAWVADPAIRDFVGLAENAWDFNSGAVPSFGTISTEDVARLMARLEAFTSPAADEGDTPAGPEPAPATAPPVQVASDTRSEPAAGGDVPATPTDEKPAAPPAPRHGRALPK